MTLQSLRRQKGLLIDTNLLVLYIIGSIDTRFITQCKRTNGRYNPDDYYLLNRFIQLFQTVITTANIITEVSNLLEGELYRNVPILSAIPQFLETVEEKAFSSLSTIQTDEKRFVKFGLSDSVTAKLAEEGYLILTDDLKLHHYLQNKGLSSLNFNNIRNLL